MDEREQRLAENEVVFRDANTHVSRAAGRHGADRHRYEFFCECSDRSCALRVEATLPEYTRVRADPRRFIVLPGHETPRIETVVARTKRYVVVEKTGAAGAHAEHRAGPAHRSGGG